MKATTLLLFSICSFILQPVFAQPTDNYKWWNPSDATFTAIAGQAWPKEVESRYDRLPAKAKGKVRDEVWNLGRHSAGEYISFSTSANSIVVRYAVSGGFAMPHMPSTGVSGVDLYARDVNGKWQWASSKYSFGDTITYRFSNLAISGKSMEFRLYLPLYNTPKWLEIGVPGNEEFTPLPASTEKPIVVYGTSIAQGACATRPGLAWTNILNRKIDLPVINLAFSGNGRLEQPVIDLINEIDAKLYVLDCMPNLTDNVMYPHSELKKRITASVKSLQTKNPNTPILLVDHASSINDSNLDTSRLHRNQYVTKALNEIFADMQREGFRNIYFLGGEAIHLGIESTVDGSHPNDIGMMEYANAYEKIIRNILQQPAGEMATTIPVQQYRDYRSYNWASRHQEVLQINKAKQPPYVIIGNSIIHFWGGEPTARIQNGPQTWNTYLAPLGVINMGYGWDRIENVLWRVYHGELDGFSAKKIVLMIGTNNLGENTDEDIITGLEHLVKAIQFKQPKATILLSGILPRRQMEERVVLINTKIATLASTLKVPYINPGPVFLKPDKKIDESLFGDGLHPNEKGYALLGRELRKYLQQ